jgi:hypothetical protein
MRRKTADAAEYLHCWNVFNRMHKSQTLSEQHHDAAAGGLATISVNYGWSSAR